MFEVRQASGKSRGVADAARGAHNLHSGSSECLDLSDPLFPAIALKAFLREYFALGLPAEGLKNAEFKSAGDDLPDAYRWCPVAPDHLRYNIQALFHPESGELQYQVVHGQIFGFVNSVLNFNKLSRFIQSMLRRWLGTMVALYFDDANIVDRDSACE